MTLHNFTDNFNNGPMTPLEKEAEASPSYFEATSASKTDSADLENTITSTGIETDSNKSHISHITEDKFHQSSDNLVVGL